MKIEEDSDEVGRKSVRWVRSNGNEKEACRFFLPLTQQCQKNANKKNVLQLVLPVTGE